MELTVLHYHFRPGGVRRVIELGLPALAHAAGCSRVTLAGGEAPPEDWRADMEAALHPCAMEWFIEPALGYWSEQTGSAAEVQGAIRQALRRLAGADTPLWVHNLSVGRNMLLARELGILPNSAPLWLHHHDWWWDGRWERWPEMQAQGYTSLAEAMNATLPGGYAVRHFCVNLTDARTLSAWTGGGFRFLPNPLTPPCVTAEETGAARAFLRRETGADQWWLYPCRGLRRKNIAEALFMQRQAAPDAVTVTTGGPSSAAEENYFRSLTTAAAGNGWPLSAAVAGGADCPPVAALMAAAESVISTSLREGFGLTYFEAALAGRGCRGRIPSGLEETLAHLAVPFGEHWRVLPVPSHCYDETREAAACAAGRERLLAMLPRELHGAARKVPATGAEGGVDFGALSLDGQLEVLAGNPAPGGPCPAPAIRPPGCWQYAWTPEPWARAFLTPEPGPPLRAGWTEEAAQLIAPLLEHWLRHPLLWP